MRGGQLASVKDGEPATELTSSRSNTTSPTKSPSARELRLELWRDPPSRRQLPGEARGRAPILSGRYTTTKEQSSLPRSELTCPSNGIKASSIESADSLCHLVQGREAPFQSVDVCGHGSRTAL